MYRLFAVTLPGLESFTRQEMLDLNLALPEQSPAENAPETGGVEFEGSLADLYLANLHLRTTNRILARLGELDAITFTELRKKAARLPWEEFLRRGQPVALRVTCHKSRLYHSDGVAERVATAIADRLGQPVERVKADEEGLLAPQLVTVRFVNDHAVISIDSSGALLHRRGYRLETAKAPLRETLAAGLLLAASWNRQSPLLDPFCGSGTIPIEAAMLARRIAPGKNRRFAFMDWPNFNEDLWLNQLEAAAAAEIPLPGPILASDRDAGAIRIAQANAERAGVAADLQLNCSAVSAIQPPSGSGWVVTNPPYGVRVSPSRDLRNLFAQFGNVLEKMCSGWKVGFLCNSDYMAGYTRIKFDEKMPLVNGGIPVRFYLGRVGHEGKQKG
jgi:putative N6-adenine-specific DNA methylase